MKKILFIGTGLTGAMITMVGLGVRLGAKLAQDECCESINTANKHLKESVEVSKKYKELYEDMKNEHTLSLQEFQERDIKAVNEMSETTRQLSVARNENLRLQKENVDMKENMNKQDSKDADINKIENALDDSKIKLFDMRKTIALSNSDKDRDNACGDIVRIIIKNIANMNESGLCSNTIHEYISEFIEAYDGMTEIISNEIDNRHSKDNDIVDSSELDELIEAIDTILLDLAELRGEIAIESNHGLLEKKTKKFSAKCKYINKRISTSKFKDVDIVVGMKKKLEEERELLKDILGEKSKLMG